MLAQLAPEVGDMTGNVKMMLKLMQQAEQAHCDILVFPEMAVTAYPPEDLLLRASFMDAVEVGVSQLVAASGTTAVVFGHPRRVAGGRLQNSATLAQGGKVAGIYGKQALPNYGVFDEQRYFTAGDGVCVFEVGGKRLGIGICEDLWDDVVAEHTEGQAMDVLLHLNASPFHLDKQGERELLMARRAVQYGVPVVYVNQVGGQDEVVFDGGSHVMDVAGRVIARAPLFDATCLMVDLMGGQGDVSAVPDTMEQLRMALVMGARDYVRHNGCTQVVLGLSGGIDSAVTAVIAVQALGAGNVLGILLPSRYSSDHSLEDAEILADHLGIEHLHLPIDPVVTAAETSLLPPFEAWNLNVPDVTEENIQARVRGLLLMAISNKTGRMLLTTGNKSEMAVGYATLYGDMAGGFAILKDTYKTQVYALARHLNREREVIPERSITKPPSAELRPDQTDADSLPDYAILDAILQAYIESEQSLTQIAAQGFDMDEVRRIASMLQAAEYKRRQAAPGVKITEKAFGRDRRYPMTHRFHE